MILAAVLSTFMLGHAEPPATRTLRVPSEAMVPTIPVGGHSNPDDLADFCGDRRKRRDAMCAKAKRGVEPVLYVKRVGLPGDKLSLHRGKLIRNGQPVDEPYTAPCDDRELCHFPRTITVPRGRYYLLGDNRGNAFDSRLWGPVPRSRLARVDRCIPQPAVGCDPKT